MAVAGTRKSVASGGRSFPAHRTSQGSSFERSRVSTVWSTIPVSFRSRVAPA